VLGCDGGLLASLEAGVEVEAKLGVVVVVAMVKMLLSHCCVSLVDMFSKRIGAVGESDIDG
jgi:hypothetical protein